MTSHASTDGFMLKTILKIIIIYYKMDEAETNLNFLKETISKFKGEIHKFTSDPNFANVNALSLRQNVEEIEKSIFNREKALVGSMLNNTENKYDPLIIRETTINTLPKIQPSTKLYYDTVTDNTFSSIIYIKQKRQENSKQHKLDPTHCLREEENSAYKKNLHKRRTKDELHDRLEKCRRNYEVKQETKRILKLHSIETDRGTMPMKNTEKRASESLMNREKILKYSSMCKKYNGEILFDEDNKPIIRKDELEKGLLNMIYKGLIPKTADLTPAFEKDGNPLRLHNNIKTVTVKEEERGDISVEKKEDFFITNDKRGSRIERESNLKRNFQLPLPLPNISKTIKTSSYDTDNMNLNEEIIREKTKRKQTSSLKKLILVFSNFMIIHNEDYYNLQKSHQDNWGTLVYLIEHLQRLFKKLNIPLIEVDGNKLLRLASDELRTIHNKDLLGCITDKELAIKGLDPSNPNVFYTNIFDLFVIRLQTAFRYFLAHKKLRKKKEDFKKVNKLQRAWRISKLIALSKFLVKEKYKRNYQHWKEMMNQFKLRWELIKTVPRLEIHVNSLSYSSAKNSTVEKFTERVNCQLNRMMGLIDPKVEIIYISPYILSNEVLSYYFSILQALGVENARERFQLIVPDSANLFQSNLSLTQLLFFSSSTTAKLREEIAKKEAYIVPGVVSKNELDLSMYLDCPILMGDYFQTMSLFTKSGALRVFEVNDLESPISEWDVKTEEHFYSSLTQLILNNLSINIWIFKIDNEDNGRGIAYIQLDKIKTFIDLKREKMSRVDYDPDKFKLQLMAILKKAVPKKIEIVTGRLYRGWDEYIQDFCQNHGVIESCPTNSLAGIIGSPAISMLIEPDGNVELLQCFDKLNVIHFRNFGAVLPRRPVQNFNPDQIAEKIGKYLYSQEIFGYVTIEFITYPDRQAIRFLAIDLKFGLTDIISSFKFTQYLFSYSIDDKLQLPDFNISLNAGDPNKYSLTPHKFCAFTIPILIHPNIPNIKMKNLTNSFKKEQLVFDLEKKSGIILNLPDTLDCGIFGICGIVNCEDHNELPLGYIDLWKLFDNAITIIKNDVLAREYMQMILQDSRSDVQDLEEVIKRAKVIVTTQMRELEKEKGGEENIKDLRF